MDVMVVRLNGIMAQVLRKGLTAVRRTGIMVPVPLKGPMAVLLPGAMAQDLLLTHEVARLAGVTARALLPARMEVQHPGAGKRITDCSQCSAQHTRTETMIRERYNMQ